MYTQGIRQEIVARSTFEAMQDLCGVVERRPGEHYSKIVEPLRFPLSADRKDSYRRAIEFLMDHPFISEVYVREDGDRRIGRRKRGGGARNAGWGIRSMGPDERWRDSPLELVEHMSDVSPSITDYMKVKFRKEWEGAPKATINFTESKGKIVGYLMRVPSEYEDDFGSPKREEDYVWNNGLWVPLDRKMRQRGQRGQR